MKRSSGILFHISSLPGPLGIGNIGPSAERFADFLAESGFAIWQVLPVSPVSTAFGNSPYSSQSAFAGNSLYISPEKMIFVGLITEENVKPYLCESSSISDYTYAAEAISALLEIAWTNFCGERDRFSDMHDDFRRFREKQRAWLDDYALFVVLKGHFKNVCWNEWPDDFRFRNDESLRSFASISENATAIEFAAFTQFIFFLQWNELHDYCLTKSISLMGDIPMFVAFDSSDVWVNKDLFDINEQCRPNCVAGVPPDYFSSTGQLWGNPLYNWDRMADEDFRWWIQRIEKTLEIFDCARIDHFRGFCGYWSVPAYCDTAEEGTWLPAPGRALFEKLAEEIKTCDRKELPLVAEDLGIITDDVREIMEEFGLPGMNILLFAFGEDVGTNPYAPHNIIPNSVVYTGTHDNNTVNGWWDKEASQQDRIRLETYVGHKIEQGDAAQQMLLLALSSVANIAIIPMQDILGLDSTGRMNIPGRSHGNWTWRLTKDEFNQLCAENSILINRLKNINIIYGRCDGKLTIK